MFTAAILLCGGDLPGRGDNVCPGAGEETGVGSRGIVLYLTAGGGTTVTISILEWCCLFLLARSNLFTFIGRALPVGDLSGRGDDVYL